MSHAVLHFAPEHPAGPGHFPGNAIIPGALLLAATVQLIASGLDRPLGTSTVKSAKFFHPVRPGDTVEIEYSLSAQQAGRQEIRFQCAVGQTKVLAGAMDAAA